MTVRELVNKISEKTGVTPLPEEKTCDHLMTGSWDMEVKGVVSTFMATVDVIRRAIDREQILLSHMSQPGFQGQMIQNGFLMIRFIWKRKS